MTANHPDADTLADLAADVLPTDQARAVESHVIGCTHCATVLQDAEQVRALLRSVDPGPMPEEVWQRLEAALAAEAPAGPVTGAQRRAGNTTGTMRRVPSGETGLQEAVPASERTQLLHRPGRIAPPTRKEHRRSGRSRERLENPARLTRLPVILVAAAALVAVAAVSTLLVRNLRDSPVDVASASRDNLVDSRASGGEAEAALVRVSRTGTNYTQATLAKQVTALLAGAPASSAAAAPRQRAPLATPATKSLADPAALLDCLAALDAPAGTRPLAVDLGSFEGREAAIIVLPAREKGYEVWAVARDCRQGNDGTIAYNVVPAK